MIQRAGQMICSVLIGCFLAQGSISAQNSVRYGSIIKLKHVATAHQLHSHDVRYKHAGGSGQQQVTCYSGDDDNDKWIVKAKHGTIDTYRAGEVLTDGDTLRLTHVATRKNLHSHSNHTSPVTNQQEVSAFGDLGVGDNNDDWILEVEGGGEWTTDKIIRLHHVQTAKMLHSHRGKSSSNTAGQQEVTAYGTRDENNRWYASSLDIPDNIIKLSKKKVRREMLKIAVVEFSERGDLGIPDAGLSVAEWFITSLDKTGAFDIYERLSFKKLQDEYSLEMSGYIDEAAIAKIGKVRGVQAIVTGSIMKFQTTISLTAKLIDTETARIIDTADIKTKSLDAIPFEVDNLAWELATEE